MSEYTTHATAEPGFVAGLRTMPAYKKGLLLISLLVGILGVGGQLVSHNLQARTPPAAAASAAAEPTRPPGSSGFMGDRIPSTATPPPAAKPADPSMTEVASPWLSKVGFSFFVGLMAGFIGRTFIKLAAILTALVIAAVAAAHHFNIDLTGVQTQAGQATSWFGGQASQMKDFVFTHLPSTTSAGAGFLFGLRRR